MMKPQDIIDEIRDDFRVGNVSMPMFIDIWVADDVDKTGFMHIF